MPVNGMSVGVDYAFSYFDAASGALIPLGDVQSIRITAQKHDIKTMPYNRVPRFGYVPDGYKIELTITRSTPALEDFMVTYNRNFNAGNVQPAGYVQETIKNFTGGVSRYQYTGTVAFLTDHGDVSRDKVTSLRLEMWASDKVAIG